MDHFARYQLLFQVSSGGKSMVELQRADDDLITLTPTDLRANPQYNVMWKQLERLVQGHVQGVS